MAKRSIHHPRVIVDCDDVLFDCNGFAIRILNQKLNTDYTINDLFKWGKLGNDLDLRLSLFDDPRFVEAQPAYPGAAAFLRCLSSYAEIIIASSVPEHCQQVRRSRIETLFPFVSTVIITQDKSWIQGDYMIDDSVMHLNSNSYCEPILFSRPWNTECHSIQRIESLSDFFPIFFQKERLSHE